uniref:YqaJ viral recombinase domain-containing protein n=1 Tax=Schizaphis graminum TaxID=13262 RepID=A0A2S2N9F1_SCHGA
MWYNERKIRLTASRFGKICKMRSNTSCKNVVHNILYASDSLQTKSVQYGREMETLARQKFEQLSKEKVYENGLIIDPEFPFLAASPDGLIGEHYLLEIKCPYSARDSNDAIEAVNSKLLQYCKVEGQEIKLKKEHVYYYQIMGQLHATKRKKCFFVIYTAKWISIEEIYFDQSFWDSKMSEPLQTFYMKSLLPEIIDPQFPKRMMKSDIREPDHIKKKMIIKKK